MPKDINLGNEKSALEVLTKIQEKKNAAIDIRIINSHILSLNAIIGRRVFKKDALYVSSETLWEIMQPIGGSGKHNHHGLTPKDVFNTLSSIKTSTEIHVSYDDRYLIVTLATIFDDVNLAVVVTPKGSLKGNWKTIVNRIITIYPYKK